MDNKKMPGFMVYFNDWDMPRQILSADAFKAFFDAVFCYARDGEVPPPFSDNITQVFFNTFMEKIRADVEHYQDKCRKASEAAKKSHMNAIERRQTQTNAANTSTNTSINTNINTNTSINNNPSINPNNNQQYQNQIQDNSQSQNGSIQTQANTEQEDCGSAEEECYQKQLEIARMGFDDDDDEIPF